MADKKRITGIFEFYSLNSINQCPKSGYDIIKEITAKSKNNIIPSKGCIYPILDDLESKGHIKPNETAARGKKTFSLTKKGQTYLETIKKKHKGIKTKMKYLPLLFSDFDNMQTETEKLAYKIYYLTDQIKDQKKVKTILKKAIKQIEEIR